MSGSSKPKVFFVVTIPTHLRVMMDAANLAAESGYYEPLMIYYPSAVFDQNHQGCVNSEHQAFVWRASGQFATAGNRKDDADGTAFRPIGEMPLTLTKSELSIIESSGEKKSRLARLLDSLPHNGTYTRLQERFSFLPQPSVLLGMLHRTWAMLRFGVGIVRKTGILIVRLLSPLYSVMYISWKLLLHKLHIRIYPQAEKLAGLPLLQRYLLAIFAENWNTPLSEAALENMGLTQRLKNAVAEGLFVGLHNQKAFVKGFSELLEKEKPALVILPEENLFYDSHLIVYCAHTRNIPCAVVPFTIVNTLEWAEAFYDVNMYQANKGWNRIFAKAFPHWVLEHRGRQLILPPVYIAASEYLGLVPDQPWVISSGPADAIAAESQFMLNYYLRAGIRSAKIRLTGTAADDKLYALLQSRDEQRSRLSARSKINIDGKVILIGLPPDQFPGGKRPGCEFDSYDELIRFMVGTLTDSSAGKHTVLINLHPRINRANVEYLESLGATIITEPIEQLVPLADIYVAVVSATIRLAISCGIPVVNYDAYQYNYDDYHNLPGVCEVNTKEAYTSTVTDLIHNEAFFSKLRSAQQDTASQVASIDGKAGSRLLALFDELSRR